MDRTLDHDDFPFAGTKETSRESFETDGEEAATPRLDVLGPQVPAYAFEATCGFAVLI